MTRVEEVAIGDARLHCRIDGPEDEGTPWVVFGNSLMTDLSMWDAQAAALAPHLRVLRYDQRGHGGSTTGSGAPSMDVLGADLAALIAHFGIGACTYVGISMGVPTGLAAHRIAPGLFERLVFVDGQAASAATGAGFWQERIALARAKGMEGLAAATAERWLGAEAVADARGDHVRRMVAGTPLDGFIYGATCLQGYDYTGEVAAISCPLLAIAGELDGAMPERMVEHFGAVPGVRLATVPGAGHLPCLEAPEAFNAILLPFLGVTG